VIERLIEPQPLEELAARDPVACERLRTQPRFLFFRLRSLQALELLGPPASGFCDKFQAAAPSRAFVT
jgi:hypothetical protein